MGSAGRAQGELTVPCICQVGAAREPGDKAASGSQAWGARPQGQRPVTTRSRPAGQRSRVALRVWAPHALPPSSSRQEQGGADVRWWGDLSKLQQSRELHIQPGLSGDEGHNGPALCHGSGPLPRTTGLQGNVSDGHRVGREWRRGGHGLYSKDSRSGCGPSLSRLEVRACARGLLFSGGSAGLTLRLFVAMGPGEAALPPAVACSLGSSWLSWWIRSGTDRDSSPLGTAWPPSAIPTVVSGCEASAGTG